MKINRFVIQYALGALLILWLLVSYTSNSMFFANLLRVAGVCLLVAGTLGRVYTTLFIGGRKNSKVIDFGCFSVMRNPLYFFSFLGAIGLMLLTGQLLLTIIVALAFLLTYRSTIAGEEDYLRSAFGQDYIDYIDRVPRFWPSLSLWQCDEIVEIKMEFVNIELKRLKAWYLGALLIVLIDTLHAYDWLPNWFHVF